MSSYIKLVQKKTVLEIKQKPDHKLRMGPIVAICCFMHEVKLDTGISLLSKTRLGFS